MIDTKELRSVAIDCFWPTSPVPINTIIDRLEAAESECLEEARLNGIGSEREAALMAKLEAAEKERDELRNEIACVKEVEFPRKAQAVADAWKGKCERLEAERDALRANIAEMEKQEPVVEVQWAAGIPNGFLDFISTDGYLPKLGDKLYSLPGAQPAPSVPIAAIEKILNEVIEIAASNGANSIGMPDEYVEVAAWLCGVSPQPAPSVPEGWKQLVQELVREVERSTCAHEETHRGGFNWEICDMCGAKWADDEGGKPEFKWPDAVEKARAMLAAAPEAKP